MWPIIHSRSYFRPGAGRSSLFLPRLEAEVADLDVFATSLRAYVQVDIGFKDKDGALQAQPRFDQLATLFAPQTVDAFYQHEGHGVVGGYKNAEGKWDTSGYLDQIVLVDDGTTALCGAGRTSR